MRRRGLVILLVALAASIAAIPTASNAASQVRDSYCSPSGDYCTYVLRAQGRTKLEIRQFPLTGPYKLCVKPPRHPRECNDYRFHRKGPAKVSRIDFARHFTHKFAGKYTVSWFWQGTKLGRALHFGKG